MEKPADLTAEHERRLAALKQSGEPFTIRVGDMEFEDCRFLGVEDDAVRHGKPLLEPGPEEKR